MTSTTLPRAVKRVKVESLGYGSGSLYQRTRDGRFEHEYTDPATRRQHRVTLAASSLKAARKEAQGRVVRIASGEIAAPTTLTFDEVASEYFELFGSLVATGERAPRTLELYRQRYTSYIEPAVGRVRIQQVQAKHLSVMLAHGRARGLSSNTLAGVLRIASTILEFAVTRGYISANPKNRLARSERPRAKNQTSARVLSAEELEALIANALPTYRVVLDVARWTALRVHELLGLRWCDIDFAGNAIHVRHQLSRATVQRPAELVPLKTEGSRRTIDMAPELRRLLLRHKIESAYSADEDFVLTTENGTPLYYRNVAERGLRKAADRAGLNPEGTQRLSMHDLRHTAITHLIRAGADIGQVARFAGHARPSMTLDRYTHEFSARDGNNIGALLSKSMAASTPNAL